MRRWYQANKEKHIALVRSREKKIKAWLREYKEFLGCELCGETHPACLEFHHVNPHEKKFSVSRVNVYLSVRLLRREIAKCRLLCANCHRKEHWDERHPKTTDSNATNKKRIMLRSLIQHNPFFRTE
jgi:hypothetical protein